MICVENVIKRFGDITAVDGIAFEIRAGEIFAFLGPNGAGKTFKCSRPCFDRRRARITIDGLDPLTRQVNVRRRFGIVFQDPSLDGELTTYENMELHGMLYHVPSKIRVERILDEPTLGLDTQSRNQLDARAPPA